MMGNICAQTYSHHYWTEQPLSWTDFVPRQIDSSNAVSEFSCYFAYEPVTDKIGGISVQRYALLCAMDEGNSWFVPEKVDYNMLRYNQVLFNLGEIICRDYQPMVTSEERAKELVDVAKQEWEYRTLEFISCSNGGKEKAVVDKWIDSTSRILKDIPPTGAMPVLKDLIGIGFTFGFDAAEYANGSDGYINSDRSGDIELFVTYGKHHIGFNGSGGRVFSNILTNLLTTGAIDELTDEATFSFSRMCGTYEFAFVDKKSTRFMPHIGLGSMTVMSNETYRNKRYVDKGFYGELGIIMDLKFSQSMNLLYESGRIMEYYARFGINGNYVNFGNYQCYGINILVAIGGIVKYGH